MSQKATLLFVDDEQRVVNLLRMIFRDDYHVLTANSGAEALDLLGRQPVDVVVSDQRMPDMLGIELLQQVAARWPSTMRMLLTGYSDLTAIVGSVNEGEVFRFINKPWDHDEIKRIVGEAVEAGHMARTGGEATVPALLELGETEPDVLLVDDNPRDLQAMQEVLGTAHNIQTATSVAAALAVLESRNVGVIVTEAAVGKANMGDFLRAVRQHYPLITTVMLTRSADADLVIKLINRAQIYRFATKPLRRTVFQLAVSGAMKEHLRFKANPKLVARHRVEQSEGAEDTHLMAAVARSLGTWRLKFLRMTGLQR